MVTLTGTFTRLDGSPASGTVRVTPSRSPILDSAGQVVISGPQVFPLDKDGKLTVEIPASNDPDLGPAFTYTVEALLSHKLWKISKVWIPHGSTTVDLSEIGGYTPTPGVATRVVTIPADGADGQVLVWDGAGFAWADPPQGPPGEVTTAALTSALAGKVTGTGMTVRVDTTVGTRVLLDHPNGSVMLHGDTGWRNVTVLPAENFTGTTRVRRIGERVTLNIDGTITPPASGNIVGTTGAFLTVSPTGNGTSVQITQHNAKTVLATAHINPSGTLFLFAPVAGSVRQEISWLTDKSWPTAPFGTP